MQGIYRRSILPRESSKKGELKMPVENERVSVRDLMDKLDDLEIQHNRPETQAEQRILLQIQIKKVVQELSNLRDTVGDMLQRTIDLRIQLTQQLDGMKQQPEKKTSADLTKAMRASHQEALRNVAQEEKSVQPLKPQEIPEQEQEAEEQPTSPKPFKSS